MNDSARNPVSGKRQRILSLLSFVAIPIGLAVLVALFPGCGKPPPQSRDNQNKSSATKESPWKTAGTRLRKEPDAATCKLVFGALNNELNADEKVPKPVGLTPDAEAALAKRVPLSDEDRAEIRGANFTAFDPVYVAECLFLHDVATRSLELPGATPQQLADLGFAWICREVYLNPWLPLPTNTTPRDLVIEVVVGNQRRPATASALAPTLVLRRGYGSGLERMYVFLALLQQMHLDGCLIGPPDAVNTHAGFVAIGADKKTILTGSPRGPFWAVGVRVGNEIRLYDPWRGEPFPATLNQLKANPDAYKSWFEDKANVSGFTAADAKSATVYLAVPVNSLAPRMATFEAQTKAELGAKFAVDPAALQAAFPNPQPVFWNPPSDRFAYGRTARTFLPVEEGGSDRTERGQNRLYESYFREQLPIELFIPPPAVKNNQDAIEKMRERAAGTYLVAFFTPPIPRELLQRGLFQAAASSLVDKQDQFTHGLERLRNNRDAEQQITQWAEAAARLYEDLGLALVSKDPNAKEQAKQAIDNHWQDNAVRLMVDRTISEVGLAEATYLLALCKHEQAERAQARLELTTGPDIAAARQDALLAWDDAVRHWHTYTSHAAAQAAMPGRAAQVKALTTRAEKLANAK